MGQRRRTLLQGVGNGGQDGALALAHLLRLWPLHYLAFVVAIEAETLHRQGHRMGQEVQLTPTLSPAPSPLSHPLQPHSAPIVLLPFTPSCIPPSNPSGPSTSLLANLCTHFTFPIPQHVSQHACKCIPQNSPQNVQASPSCHLQPTPLHLSRAGGRPGSSHHLSILPSPLPSCSPLSLQRYLAEEGQPALGTAPTCGSRYCREGRLHNCPIASLADIRQCCHALLVPPVLCREGQAGHDAPLHWYQCSSPSEPHMEPCPALTSAGCHVHTLPVLADGPRLAWCPRDKVEEGPIRPPGTASRE